MASYETSPVVYSRLNPPPDEIEKSRVPYSKYERNWSPIPGALYVGYIDRPLLRTWDRMSGSQPDEAEDMFARDRDQPLRTADVRRETLELHLDHSNWAVNTPYISFQASEQSLRELAEFRKTRPKRETQIITVIDPKVRLRAGWPVLSVGEEMRYYGIPKDTYGNPPEKHNNHYVCLWQVKEEEIVGHWLWKDLSQNPDWYNTEILPAFQQFRHEKRQREQEEHQRFEQERQQALADGRVDDILGAMGALGLNDVAASASSQALSGQPTQWGEQADDSGIGSDDEPEGTSVRAML
ncbi:hypothetical protein N0V84_010435 [Fusarium piperis]|uniref:DUF7587 domain-containing protein n=1 Tax=Fusarium piperis TaxID=1435070 RepID=A0A9W8W465_9HYPO|nr:hypothetical protein N0V84_010435 [Fusarium piperis]